VVHSNYGPILQTTIFKINGDNGGKRKSLLVFDTQLRHSLWNPVMLEFKKTTVRPGKKGTPRKCVLEMLNLIVKCMLIKLSALVLECIFERTTKFHQKILFDSGVINLQIPMTKYLCFQYSANY